MNTTVISYNPGDLILNKTPIYLYSYSAEAENYFIKNSVFLVINTKKQKSINADLVDNYIVYTLLGPDGRYYHSSEFTVLKLFS